ncbi:MAG TPA: hypothetical protein VH087_00605 [Thermoanaerobaculia bacterium]|jgi:hypothetical protein|nr:hypothetical protein [Thermoanaerobaculia bacterium]
MSSSIDVPAGNDPAKPAMTAEEMISMLRDMRERIPNFTQLTVANVRSMVPAASLHPDFVLGSIHVTGASPIVQQVVGSPQDSLLQDASDDSAWSVAEEEMRGLLKGVAAANLVRRHRLGKSALLAYNVSRQLVRKPEHVNLIPHVEELQRLRRLGRRKKTAPAPQTTTPPQQS